MRDWHYLVTHKIHKRLLTPGGVRMRSDGKRAAEDPRLRQRGHCAMILPRENYITTKTDLFQRHFVHLKVRTDWPEIEPRSLRCEIGEYCLSQATALSMKICSKLNRIRQTFRYTFFKVLVLCFLYWQRLIIAENQ